MCRLGRLTYAPTSAASCGPSPENLRLAQRTLQDVPLPELLGRALEQHEHVMRESSYLSKVWETFRLSVNEKDILASFLRDVPVGRLDCGRRDLALLDIGPDDGQLTLRVCGPFSRLTLVEADVESFDRLQRNVARQSQETLGFPECRLIHARFPCAGLDKDAYDLAMLLHVLYFIPRDLWVQSVRAAYETLRPGGMLVAAYVCDEGSLAEAIAHFKGLPSRFGEFEDACALAFPEAEIEAYRMTSIMAAMEEDGLAHLLGFLMADYQATGTADEVRAYCRRFRRADGTYVWEKTDGALIVRRPP